MSPQEIIEFPILMVNAATLETEATFHYYVKPQVHPVLSAFCTELTGITQRQVDGGLSLAETLQRVDKWLVANSLGVAPSDNSRSFVVCTCGDWDLKHLLKECAKKGISEPWWARSFCNVKMAYEVVFGTRKIGMAGMLTQLQLELDGHHHSGIDDSRNIAKVVVQLVRRGVVIQRTTDKAGSAFPWHGPSNAALGVRPIDSKHVAND
eukprot:gnl/TRDRNA2_/TRDRNA2_170153_c2_seq1.p1 gnl/TRDRNA2_/TRDRNA2_170153_c2~~gnl/TRDRNA2_/TRDRNA2_170153_c2_seq1.p1  ORF type:complete len:239 (+),score=27.22 gnl/TRDRNA2_/TRDRNA2_170153_c2_seq1:96-719(+)